MGREKFSIAAFKKFANSSNLIRNEKQNLSDSSQYFARKKMMKGKKKYIFLNRINL